MTQGQFTKAEAGATITAVEEIFQALPKSRQMDYLGHLNDVMLFLEAVKRAAPEKAGGK